MHNKIAFILAAILLTLVSTSTNAQSSPEIERLTAEIAKKPENDLLYIERGRLYTWNGKYIGPNVPFSDIGKTIDENRLKALADADMAVKKGPQNYKTYYFRANLIKTIGSSYSGRNTYQQDIDKAASLFNESSVVANILKFDLSGGKTVYPPYTDSVPVLNVVVKGRPIGLRDGFDSLEKAREYAKKRDDAQVLMLNKTTGKHFLYEAFVTENIYPNIQLAETPFRYALNGKSTIPLTYEFLKIEPEYSVQPIPKIAGLDSVKHPWQFVDLLDANGLTLVKNERIPLMRGSKGIRTLLDNELTNGRFDEALAIYNWLDKRNTSTGGNDLDVVKITRKTNLSKIYQYAEKLRPFVEKEMEKWKYAEADRKAVRGTIGKGVEKDATDIFESLKLPENKTKPRNFYLQKL